MKFGSKRIRIHSRCLGLQAASYSGSSPPMSNPKSDKWPQPREVAARVLVLKYVIVNAMATPPRDKFGESFMSWTEAERVQFVEKAETERQKFWGRISDVGLADYLSPSERAISQFNLVTMPLQVHADSFWRIEAVQMLLWALGGAGGVPPYDTRADFELLKRVPHQNIHEYIEQAALRPTDEIAKARDVSELWHWRSRTRFLVARGDEYKGSAATATTGVRTFDDIVRMTANLAEKKGDIPPAIDGDFPAKGKAYRDLSEEEWSEIRSITSERHHALNWLCGYAPNNQWDDTPTDT